MHSFEKLDTFAMHIEQKLATARTQIETEFEAAKKDYLQAEIRLQTENYEKDLQQKLDETMEIREKQLQSGIAENMAENEKQMEETLNQWKTAYIQEKEAECRKMREKVT